MLRFETDQRVEPLNWPPGKRPPLEIHPASRWERWAWNLPVVGPFVQSRRWQQAARPLIESVNLQLARRPEIVIRTTPEAGDLLRWLAHRIKKKMGWVNARYVPDDPTEILLFSHQDGLDAESLRFELEDCVDDDLGDSYSLMLEYPTYGSLVDHLAEKLMANRGTLRLPAKLLRGIHNG